MQWLNMKLRFVNLICILISSTWAQLGGDPNGYLTYCPCMGRFGNQADHFLGSLAFAKALNRTLILPPWVEYRRGELRSRQVPFNTYFEVEPLKEYHRVITMADFMWHLADDLWPESDRVSFCYKERFSLQQEKTTQKSPIATPRMGIRSVRFGTPSTSTFNEAAKWQNKYPAESWPVLAFTGAPASFPVQLENCKLQRYMQWSQRYRDASKDFIREQLPRGAFVGIHLRNGIDWVRACEHVKDSQHLFASPQCLGYKNERGALYPELCMPSKEAIIRQLKRTIKNVRQTQPDNEIKSVFVASDSNHMIGELSTALSRMGISVHKLPEDDPYLDLAILERDSHGFPSYFWGFPKEKDRKHSNVHEEL
ncbi:hypothetical protein M5D96_010204 [Drosophila gunungcola]|uniref:GDP-fucose protein O-fucosyltransferase 1 n=1 Tax=Drosophila gunungcola TaxID=103775 RepID=A0A9P9YHW1_9MUSC|nr:hypothetical protein M5D96_010204 [Drosophila gunungcola]